MNTNINQVAPVAPVTTVKISFVVLPPRSEDRSARHVEEMEAVREVVRALNRYAYEA